MEATCLTTEAPSLSFSWHNVHSVSCMMTLCADNVSLFTQQQKSLHLLRAFAAMTEGPLYEAKYLRPLEEGLARFLAITSCICF